MGKNKNANKALTQEEIWDDSALVRTWDEAVDEYKLYHSIHAKGENVEDVLREAEAADITADDEVVDENADYMEAEYEPPVDVDTAAVVEETHEAPQVDVSQVPTEPEVSHGQKAEAGTNVPPTAPMPMPMPQATLAQVQDEGLKNLMMAWYYAGYYTGLYEGQQKANQK